MKSEWKHFHPEALNWKGLSEIRHSAVQLSAICVGLSTHGRHEQSQALRVSSTCSLSAGEHKPRSFPHKYELLFMKRCRGLGGKAASLQRVWGCCSHTCQNECSCLAPQCCPGHPLPALLQLLFLSSFFCVCAPQFEWGLRRSGEDRAAHLHLRRYTDGHPGEPAGDGGCVPGQAAQVSPPSQPPPALLRAGTGENPCLKSPMPAAESINRHNEGCLSPCIAHGDVRLSHWPLCIPTWIYAVVVGSFQYPSSTFLALWMSKNPDKSVKNRAKQQFLGEAGWPLPLFHLKFPNKTIRKPCRSRSCCSCAALPQLGKCCQWFGGVTGKTSVSRLAATPGSCQTSLRSRVRNSTASIHILRGIFNGFNSILLLWF